VGSSVTSCQSFFGRLPRSFFSAPPRALGPGNFGEVFFPLEPGFGPGEAENLFEEAPAGRVLESLRFPAPGCLDGPEGLPEYDGLSGDHSFFRGWGEPDFPREKFRAGLASESGHRSLVL